MKRTGLHLAATLFLASFAAISGCDEESEDGGAGESMNTCDVYEFEYDGEPEDGVCPRLECCPDDADGTFSALDNGRCLSAANCEAVCENTDEAFECL